VGQVLPESCRISLVLPILHFVCECFISHSIFSLGLGYYSSNVSSPTAVEALKSVNMERVWAGGRASFMSSQVIAVAMQLLLL
jgi:hypothetical protein